MPFESAPGPLAKSQRRQESIDRRTTDRSGRQTIHLRRWPAGAAHDPYFGAQRHDAGDERPSLDLWPFAEATNGTASPDSLDTLPIADLPPPELPEQCRWHRH